MYSQRRSESRTLSSQSLPLFPLSCSLFRQSYLLKLYLFLLLDPQPKLYQSHGLVSVLLKVLLFILSLSGEQLSTCSNSGSLVRRGESISSHSKAKLHVKRWIRSKFKCLWRSRFAASCVRVRLSCDAGSPFSLAHVLSRIQRAGPGHAARPILGRACLHPRQIKLPPFHRANEHGGRRALQCPRASAPSFTPPSLPQ